MILPWHPCEQGQFGKHNPINGGKEDVGMHSGNIFKAGVVLAPVFVFSGVVNSHPMDSKYGSTRSSGGDGSESSGKDSRHSAYSSRTRRHGISEVPFLDRTSTVAVHDRTVLALHSPHEIIQAYNAQREYRSYDVYDISDLTRVLASGITTSLSGLKAPYLQVRTGVSLAFFPRGGYYY